MQLKELNVGDAFKVGERYYLLGEEPDYEKDFLVVMFASANRRGETQMDKNTEVSRVY